MKLYKIMTVCIYIIFFLFYVYSTEMEPTREEVFISDFLKTIYTFNNNTLQDLGRYKLTYPMDKYSLKLKNSMTESAFEDFSKKRVYYSFIIDSYNLGFNSSISDINIKLINASMNNFTFSFSCNMELFYQHKSKKELYKVNGEITITKFNNGFKISKITKFKFPSIGAFPVVSKLV